MFASVSLRKKLISGFTLLVGVLLVVGLTGYTSLNRVIDQADEGYLTLELDAELNGLIGKQMDYAMEGTDEQYTALTHGLEGIKGRVDRLGEVFGESDAVKGLIEGRALYTTHLDSLKVVKKKKGALKGALLRSAAQAKEIMVAESSQVEASTRSEVLENSAYYLKKNAYAAVRNLMDAAHDAVKAMHEGGISRDDALAVVRKMHFDGGNYFFVMQPDFTLVAHGADNSLEGMDFSKIRDKKNGQTFMVDVVSGAVKEGSSVTEYYWSKPGMGDAVFPKVTVARYYKPWNMVICTGIYIDDIETAGRELSEVIENGFNRLTQIDEVTDSLMEARLGVYNYMLFHTDSQAVNKALGDLMDMDAATDAVKVSVGEYHAAWDDYVVQDTLEMDTGKAAQGVIHQASTAMHVMSGKAKVAFGESAASGKMVIVLFILAGGVLAIGAAFMLIVSITTPLKQASTMLQDIAEGDGDLTQRLHVSSRDELGEMAHWFNLFVGKLQKMIEEIAGNSKTLSDSSSRLMSLAGQMAQGADSTSAKAHTVATASEQMSGNMDEVARETEQSSANINTMASATEEMTSTIGEIAQNSESARAITGEAVNQAKRAKEKVGALGDAALAIGKVTDTIGEISGERIGGVQASTDDTVTEIDAIAEVIDKVNQIVITIAAAIEEQSVTTAEISGTINQASSGIQLVSDKILESTRVSRDMAGEISDVNETAGEMSGVTTQVQTNASELQDLADQLISLVGRFKV